MHLYHYKRIDDSILLLPSKNDTWQTATYIAVEVFERKFFIRLCHARDNTIFRVIYSQKTFSNDLLVSLQNGTWQANTIRTDRDANFFQQFLKKASYHNCVTLTFSFEWQMIILYHTNGFKKLSWGLSSGVLATDKAFCYWKLQECIICEQMTRPILARDKKSATFSEEAIVFCLIQKIGRVKLS